MDGMCSKTIWITPVYLVKVLGMKSENKKLRKGMESVTKI